MVATGMFATYRLDLSHYSQLIHRDFMIDRSTSNSSSAKIMKPTTHGMVKYPQVIYRQMPVLRAESRLQRRFDPY